jgi:WW domain-binding protein 4
MEGVAGDWQVVDPTPTEPPSDTGEESKQHGDDTQNPEASEETSKKRAVPDPADEDEGRWKLRKKSTAVGLGEIYDPGVIAIKPKVKAEETSRITTQSSAGTSVVGDANATALPRWAPVKWKKAGEPADDTNGETSSGPADGDTSPTEQPQQALPDSSDADVKPEPDTVVDAPLTLSEEVTGTSSGGSLFRKRRAPVGGGVSNRGRRF